LNEAQLMQKRLPRGVDSAQALEAGRKVRRVLIARTLWYPEELDALEASARAYLKSVGVPDAAVKVVDMPGSFELPLGVLQAVQSEPVDFAVALGCIVRGGTPHFDYVSRAAVDGLMKVSLDTRVPVGLGVLTVDSLEQARARLDKGAEAAQAAFFLWLQSPRKA
jgi:6,7-dimethyl-8-ribityllumazine synthase